MSTHTVLRELIPRRDTVTDVRSRKQADVVLVGGGVALLAVGLAFSGVIATLSMMIGFSALLAGVWGLVSWYG